MDDLRESGGIHTMEVDLDGDRKKEIIRLSAKADGSVQAILEDNGRDELDLFELVLDTVPLLHYIEDSGNVRMEWEEKYSRMSKEQLKREYEGFKSGRISTTAHMGARYSAFRKVCQDRGYLH